MSQVIKRPHLAPPPAPADAGSGLARPDRTEWRRYYSKKRILHQWTQLDLLLRTGAETVLEVGPAYGLVTSLLVNAGFRPTTLDIGERAFASPDVPHLRCDLRYVPPTAIAGFDAILCCETLEHVSWDDAMRVLAVFASSGARHLVVSVPYSGPQIALDLHLNAFAADAYFSAKLDNAFKRFAPEPPGEHQWEIGFRGRRLADWEEALAAAGWRIAAREFTYHCRSVFHLLENAAA